jgi:hypothetical protein
MRKFALFLFVFVLLSGCAPSPEQIATPLVQTLTAWPSNTPYPTYTKFPTLTPNPTYTLPPTQTPKIVIVTATYTATPLYTPTITNTPLPTRTPVPTIDPLKKNKSAGIYLVNVDIAPGVWRSNGTQDNCYWKITK